MEKVVESLARALVKTLKERQSVSDGIAAVLNNPTALAADKGKVASAKGKVAAFLNNPTAVAVAAGKVAASGETSEEAAEAVAEALAAEAAAAGQSVPTPTKTQEANIKKVKKITNIDDETTQAKIDDRLSTSTYSVFLQQLKTDLENLLPNIDDVVLKIAELIEFILKVFSRYTAAKFVQG